MLEWSCGHKYARSLEEGTSNTPRGGVQGVFPEEGHWHRGCEGRIGVHCAEKETRCAGADGR